MNATPTRRSPARASSSSPPNSPSSQRAVAAALHKYWGYSELRPLQREAIDAGIARTDSLVVLPTGGGKSLCYQIPPLVTNRIDVVVSPLISLMKDQVDALKACGYPATALHSGLSEEERRRAVGELMAGKHRLVFVAPERLLTPWFMGVMERLNVGAFAIDEAHCISQWGHDFRPEYRRLATLKERYPQASIHAFTATATPRVREDIVRQLKLQSPRTLVGRFDRPNLVYRVIPRTDIDAQVTEAVRRHKDEAAIVYCISRADTERMAEVLRARGVKAAAYHAGLDPVSRARTQEAFAAEKLDVVVATVAFGMGIDRSNVRCVIHAALPKSIEHYQQETGRAGRDGLEAECVLFYSPADFRRWESVLRRGGDEGGEAQANTQIALLAEMQRLAAAGECRHRALSRYFGQEYERPACGACDVCLGEWRQPEVGVRTAASEAIAWEGVDRGLFERLRELRRAVAAEQGVPPFIVFSDATLRELARVRPSSAGGFGRVKGVGERKLAELGSRFVAQISDYCRDKGIAMDVAAEAKAQPARATSPSGMTASKRLAFQLFEKGRSLDEVATATGRARGTISNYLEDYVMERKPESVEVWVAPALYGRIEMAAKQTGGSLLKPVFEALNGEVSYDEIRVVMRHAGLK
ncbi:MAG: RecQ family ATP-dependent DNA helicase [Dehalococcoidia bacterium]|nr:RecQ family ATP-dependent DNA helicase [Dehalococcoidia bacterium]